MMISFSIFTSWIMFIVSVIDIISRASSGHVIPFYLPFMVPFWMLFICITANDAFLKKREYEMKIIDQTLRQVNAALKKSGHTIYFSSNSSKA